MHVSVFGPPESRNVSGVSICAVFALYTVNFEGTPFTRRTLNPFVTRSAATSVAR
jgi:hypothetical protein